MPNLVVYVPAKMWKRLEDELGTEFPSWARQMTVKHMQEFLEGLSERGEAMVSEETSERSVGAPRMASSYEPETAVPRSESPSYFPERSDEVKSDFVERKRK